MWIEVIYALNIIVLLAILTYCALSIHNLCCAIKHRKEMEQVTGEITTRVINEFPAIFIETQKLTDKNGKLKSKPKKCKVPKHIKDRLYKYDNKVVTDIPEEWKNAKNLQVWVDKNDNRFDKNDKPKAKGGVGRPTKKSQGIIK